MSSNLKRFYDRGRLLCGMLSIKAFRKKKYPFYVNLVINSSCNLNCSYCFGKYAHRPPRNITFDDFKELTDLLIKKGIKYILIQGGEPLLHPELGKMIKYLYDKKIITALVTNGSLPEKIRKIPELDLMDNICFSLDGNREGNDRVRGKGSFDKVLESIAEVKKNYTVPVRINSTIHKFVHTDIDFMAKFMKEKKIEWGINFLFSGKEKAEGESLVLTREQMIDYLKKLLEYKKAGYPIFTTSKIIKYTMRWVSRNDEIFSTLERLKKINFQKPIECQYGNYEIAIDEDYKIYPCQGLQNIFPAKSIKDCGFDEAFKNLENKPCYSCYIPSMINTSAMINWDLSVIFETIWETFRNRFLTKKCSCC
ncbi:radical SAM protein [Candidatus Dependentiae bacterium]|nr:radical SAM protein [Candidatus Dependentiae bacterium]